MKLFFIEIEGCKEIAVEIDYKLYLLKDFGYDFKDINELIDSEINLKDLCFNNQKEIKNEYKILSPIEYPKQDIICIGMNYIDHKDEVEKVSKKDFSKDVDTIYFSKRANKILGNDDFIPINREITEKLDYEIELAVIIGKDGKNIKKEEANNYIFGFSIFNDLSARDLQTKYKQWYYGKSFDGSSVMGPCILLNDKSFDYNKLDIKLSVNREIRQDSNTKNMILGVNEIIEDLSKSMTLKKGTIIATGTPSGVGMALNPPIFLQSGDTIELEIEKIGVLENTVK
ncbi:fumarylacetoacetate hydrolase family protein [Peptoniphilus sp.]|uniref:fumarylacetoacetate hydrolase family protein n=1 Tax=Peptoniphilus sp. TaxID=1971214 RepID=UPI002A804732|nr:fumarylacetoacetate hydrolase family protein [Peptoniphilus sp.]MDY3902710.1 fumarylacetoacetate hydrolase family protein [Peptoniphilus sp.]